jgi:tetratricopeptide repeat protein 30
MFDLSDEGMHLGARAIVSISGNKGVQTSPEEAYRKFDELANKHIEMLRKLTKQIQDARMARDNEAIKRALKEYDEALEKSAP